MMGLDNIVGNEEGAIQQKQKMYDDLLQKYHTLKSSSSEIAVSYSLDLNLTDQLKYANMAMFRYWMDLNKKSTAYKVENNGGD